MNDETVTADQLRDAAGILRAANIVTNSHVEDYWSPSALEAKAEEWDAQDARRNNDIRELARDVGGAVNDWFARCAEGHAIVEVGSDDGIRFVAQHLYGQGWRRP